MTEPNTPEGMDPEHTEHTESPKNAESPRKATAGTPPEPLAVPDVTPTAGERPRAEDEPDLSPDELALRRLLRDAVQDLHPGPETLTHLRRAVPARRAHRRQLLVGTAAAGLLAVAAVPAVLHATNTSGWDTPNPVAAAGASSSDSSDAAHSTEGTKDEQPSGPATGVVAAPTAGGGGKHDAPGTPDGDPTPHTTESSGDTVVSSPACTAADLGSPTGWAGAADAAGRITGYFRVANVSAGPCTIDGGGVVNATAQGSADPTRISVLDHVAGDGSGLPDAGPEPLVLQAGASYEVQFAWVPAAGGDISGCAAPPTSPTPTPTGSGEPTSGSTTSGQTITTLDSAPADGAPAASVQLSHTPDAGSPVVTATLAGACAGTIYHTGPLAVS
ncbi:hypothetical protein ACIP98_16720 [Streptomyces sp. NPDC088354]|uniref:hypothetical protein n=1 Tax=unclassified Streptomyces TaxID=2593676 RepID=UPI0029B15B63|nr:hypothetical protein [Streptomyces sp. MI02-7b]MDX3076811.1 hypothetical protein [Streptomyces sp. MI02-7b]